MSGVQIILSLLTLIIYRLQINGSFVVPIELQLCVLYIITIFYRMSFKRDMFGEVKLKAVKRYGVSGTKKITSSKTYWLMIISIYAAITNYLANNVFSFNVDILKYSVLLSAIIGVLLGFFTRRPIELK